MILVLFFIMILVILKYCFNSGISSGFDIYFTQMGSKYEASDYISTEGTALIYFASLGFYFLMYFFGVLLGTARFARSSVLLANKLPGNL